MNKEEAIELLESKRNKLEKLGVKYPKENSDIFLGLLYLTMHIGEEVYCGDVLNFVTLTTQKFTGIKIRKLWSDYGFNIIGKNELKSPNYKLIDLDTVSPKYNANKRFSKPSIKEFEKIKKKYDYKCVSCGCKEGEPHPLNPLFITRLEMGHRDPNKNLTVDNCIPQCPYCNQRNRDDYIYDNMGGIEKINNIDILFKLLDNNAQKVFVKKIQKKYGTDVIKGWLNESIKFI